MNCCCGRSTTPRSDGPAPQVLVVDGMAKRNLSLSTFGAGFLLSLYQLGKDDIAESMLDDWAGIRQADSLVVQSLKA